MPTSARRPTSPHRRSFPLAAGALLLACFSARGEAQTTANIDPRGVYFHTYTGPSSAIEWIHIRERVGDRRYQFSDIRGIAPYEGHIALDGNITWDTTPTTAGSGAFSSPDDATMTLTFGGSQFQSTLRRAPGTDANFITQLDSRTTGSTALAGEWALHITELDAATGAMVATSQTRATVSVTGDLVRLTYDDGTFYQGVFEEEDHAGFRVIIPGNTPQEFRSFAGSETSLNLNLLGDLRLTGTDTFSATFLTQTRRPPGFQDQFVHVVSATRVPAPASSAVCIGCVLVGMYRRRWSSHTA